MVVGLNVYNLRLRLESPVALPVRRARQGYLGVPSTIPATTLRGATITALYNKGALNSQAITQESQNPSIIASPAYPVINGRESQPAHPFVFVCKKCGAMYVFSEAFQMLSRGEEVVVPTECRGGHRALRQLHPSPFIEDDREAWRGTITGFRYVSVGISRKRASAVGGILYSYEMLAESQEFWATLASTLPLELDGLLLLVGRGASRGLGRVRVRAEEVSLDDFSEKAEGYAAKRGGAMLFTAMSHLLGPDKSGDGWSNYPKEIDLSAVSRRLGLQLSGKLILEKVLGKTVTLDLGWDMARGVLRPRFEAKAPGSVVVARPVQMTGKLGLVMAVLRFIGVVEFFDGFPLTGVNMLSPLEV